VSFRSLAGKARLPAVFDSVIVAAFLNPAQSGIHSGMLNAGAIQITPELPAAT
jgi:hypothetical protein